jgi:hypothetical protein
MPVPFARQDGQIGFPLDPIVLLRNPGFPRPGFPSFQRFSAVSTDLHPDRAAALGYSTTLHLPPGLLDFAAGYAPRKRL